GFIMNALPWPLVALFPFFPDHASAVFAVIVFVSNLSNAVCGVTWWAAVSELVPLNIRGQYFGTRNMMFSFWALITVLVSGQIADHFHNSIRIFGIIFGMAALARLIGLFFLTRMKFPAIVMQRQPQR